MTTNQWHQVEQTRYDGVCDVCEKAFDEGFTYATNVIYTQGGWSSGFVDLCNKCLNQWKDGKTIITQKEAFDTARQVEHLTDEVK